LVLGEEYWSVIGKNLQIVTSHLGMVINTNACVLIVTISLSNTGSENPHTTSPQSPFGWGVFVFKMRKKWEHEKRVRL